MGFDMTQDPAPKETSALPHLREAAEEVSLLAPDPVLEEIRVLPHLEGATQEDVEPVHDADHTIQELQSQLHLVAVIEQAVQLEAT